MNDQAKFSTQVKAVRQELSMSQEELAREIGVSFATLNRWENAKTSPSKLGRTQFEKACARMARRGNLAANPFA